MGRVVKRESGKWQDSQKASSVSSLSSGHPLFPPHTHCSETIQSIVVHPTAPSYQWGDPHFLPNIQCECHCILLPNLICSTCLTLSPPSLSIPPFLLLSPPLPFFPSPSPPLFLTPHPPLLPSAPPPSHSSPPLLPSLQVPASKYSMPTSTRLRIASKS